MNSKKKNQYIFEIVLLYSAFVKLLSLTQSVGGGIFTWVFFLYVYLPGSEWTGTDVYRSLESTVLIHSSDWEVCMYATLLSEKLQHGKSVSRTVSKMWSKVLSSEVFRGSEGRCLIRVGRKLSDCHPHCLEQQTPASLSHWVLLCQMLNSPSVWQQMVCISFSYREVRTEANPPTLPSLSPSFQSWRSIFRPITAVEICSGIQALSLKTGRTPILWTWGTR